MSDTPSDTTRTDCPDATTPPDARIVRLRRLVRAAQNRPDVRDATPRTAIADAQRGRHGIAPPETAPDPSNAVQSPVGPVPAHACPIPGLDDTPGGDSPLDPVSPGAPTPVACEGGAIPLLPVSLPVPDPCPDEGRTDRQAPASVPLKPWGANADGMAERLAGQREAGGECSPPACPPSLARGGKGGSLAQVLKGPGNNPTRAARLLGQAIDEQWQLPPDLLGEVVDFLGGLVRDRGAPASARVSASKTLAVLKAQNMEVVRMAQEAERKAEPAAPVHQTTVNVFGDRLRLLLAESRAEHGDRGADGGK